MAVESLPTHLPDESNVLSFYLVKFLNCHANLDEIFLVIYDVEVMN